MHASSYPSNFYSPVYELILAHGCETKANDFLQCSTIRKGRGSLEASLLMTGLPTQGPVMLLGVSQNQKTRSPFINAAGTQNSTCTVRAASYLLAIESRTLLAEECGMSN